MKVAGVFSVIAYTDGSVDFVIQGRFPRQPRLQQLVKKLQEL